MWVATCGATDRELMRECIAATYGMIEFIDDGVGRMIAAIERLGQLDNTIIVFTSDHGDMMGDHGLMLKGFLPFTGTQHVSMVVADPRRAPRRSRAALTWAQRSWISARSRHTMVCRADRSCRSWTIRQNRFEIMC